MCESKNSSISGIPIIKISSCFKEAFRITTPSLSSEETVSSSDLTEDLTSARSSCTSSGYSGMSSLHECFEIEATPKPFLSRQRERGSLAKLFGEPEGSASSDDKETASVTLLPSLKMIRRLKRLSDAWSNACRCTDEVIVDRLKKGREEAIKKQTYIEELLNEASCQYNIQQQAHALLHICPEENDVDEVEAERIILLAGERYKAYLEEAERIVTDLGPSTWKSIAQRSLTPETCHPATVYISDIKLKLSVKFYQYLQSSQKNYNHHFLCLLKEKKTKGIIATQIISTQAHNTSHILHFSNRLTLPQIPPNFFLTIEVYHMSNEEQMKNKKNKLSRVFSTVKRMPSLKRYRYLSCTGEVMEGTSSRTCSATSLNGLQSKNEETIIQSNFVSVGKVEASKKELFSSTTHKIHEDEIASKIELIVTADPLYPSPNLEGYLNMYTTKWERRWFAFSEFSLKCWLFQDHPQQNKKPLCEWSIEDCINVVHSTSLEKGAWKYTFVLPLRDMQELLLAAHSPEQEHEWTVALNSIIHSNIEWRPSIPG